MSRRERPAECEQQEVVIGLQLWLLQLSRDGVDLRVRERLHPSTEHRACPLRSLVELFEVEAHG